jgi:hypothetical protein
VAYALRRIRPNAYRIGSRDGVTTVALRSAMRATSGRPARVLIQPLREDGRLAVVEVAGGGEQGQIELVGDLAEVPGGLPPLWLRQFGQVPAAELGERSGLWLYQRCNSVDGAMSRSHSSRRRLPCAPLGARPDRPAPASRPKATVVVNPAIGDVRVHGLLHARLHVPGTRAR